MTFEYVTLEDATEYMRQEGWVARDLGLLESELARPSAVVFGEDAYPSLHLKAAALMDSVARSHPMIDGNKRLSLALVDLFSRLNGYRITATTGPVVEFVLRVAGEHPPLEELVDWFEENTAAV